MEKQPPQNPDDREPNNHHPEDLEPSEIDLTGAVQQDDALREVVRDALIEVQVARAAGGGYELPEWGARAIARALANRQEEPTTGPLHYFAITGRIDKEAITNELAELYKDIPDQETADLALLLGLYIDREPETPNTPTSPGKGDDVTSTDKSPAPREDPSRQQEAIPEIPINGTPLEKVSAYLQTAFAEADARREPISTEDAQAIATMLAQFLSVDAQMHRFAETGEAEPAALLTECQSLKGRDWQSPDIEAWLNRLEQYLTARTDPKKNAGTAETSDTQQAEQGIREHGDAFRAFLTLSNIGEHQDDLLTSFQDFYIGTYGSMEALFEAMTDIRRCKAEVEAVAQRQGFDGFFIVDQERVEATARAMWDIVEMDGRLHVFTK